MFPCPKCTSAATHPSSDKSWTDGVLRIVQFMALRCHLCNHRFHAFMTPGERTWLRERRDVRAVVHDSQEAAIRTTPLEAGAERRDGADRRGGSERRAESEGRPAPCADEREPEGLTLESLRGHFTPSQ